MTNRTIHYINLDTLDTIKNLNKNIVISQWNEDPIMKSLKDSKANIDKISNNEEININN